MKKTILFSIVFLTTLTLMTLGLAYPSEAAYNYGPNSTVSSAESLVVEKVVDSSNLRDTSSNLVSSTYQFGSLVDVATDKESELIYAVDETNNVVVVLNEKYEFITYFPQQEDEVTLKNPKGIYLTNDAIYVCDYGNNRIAIFDRNYKIQRYVETPDDPAFKDYQFRPKKITVNRTGRMYVVAENINEGIIDFNPDGTFSRYYGMNSVTVTGWQAFWLLFTSEKQREAQGYNFGASLSNLCIDKDEYIYTVSSPSAGATNVIKKLNYKGSDVLVRNGYVQNNGDATVLVKTNTSVPTGDSTFIDIDVNEIGTYIALDKTRGRIFAYDFEGNLLYIGGQIQTNLSDTASTQSGMFQIPEALCYYKDKILVVDSKNNNLVIFQFTEFGSLINEATELYYQNKYPEAAEKWEEVRRLDTNYYLAYSGIGKAQLREGDYKNAMTNLKLGYDKYNYSRAYQQYRYERMVKVVPYVIGVGLVLCVFFLGLSVYKNIKHEEREKEGLE
jgi:hypothetical protein